MLRNYISYSNSFMNILNEYTTYKDLQHEKICSMFPETQGRRFLIIYPAYYPAKKLYPILSSIIHIKE